MRRAALVLVCALAGCVALPPGLESSVADVRETDRMPAPAVSSLPPAQFAACIVANIEKSRGDLTPSVIAGPAPGATEIQLRGPYGIAAIYTVASSGAGSTVEARVSRHYGGIRARTAVDLSDGC